MSIKEIILRSAAACLLITPTMYAVCRGAFLMLEIRTAIIGVFVFACGLGLGWLFWRCIRPFVDLMIEE